MSFIRLTSRVRSFGMLSSFCWFKARWFTHALSYIVFLGRRSMYSRGSAKTGCFSAKSSNYVGETSSCNDISEKYGIEEKLIKPTLVIFDPCSKFVHDWNTYFFVASLGAVFVDPLFIYLTVMNAKDGCQEIQQNYRVFITVLRTITDVIFIFHIFLQFRTAFFAPASTVLGRGELVLDPLQIAKRYLKKHFLLDFAAILPLPQIAVWSIIPSIKDSNSDHAKHAWRFMLLCSYILRLRRVYLMILKMIKTTGLITKTALFGAAYNLFLFMLASHVIGACWYSLAVQRHFNCWQENCKSETGCKLDYLYCGSKVNKFRIEREEWFSSTNVFKNCSCDSIQELPEVFNFGIYRDAIASNITSSTNFPVKYTFSFRWGLKNLGSLGQGITNGPCIEETVFAIVLSILGLFLVALLVGNMKVYLISMTQRIEQMRRRRNDTESWMHHRKLPQKLRDQIQRYDKYKWVATRGVDEESILQSLPSNLRREIKRHLCLGLVRNVPLFNRMDNQLLDFICELLKQSLHTADSYVIREGDQVHEMTFIVRGHLHSTTTNGKAGFSNSSYLGPGDFCGEELLNWALDPNSDEDSPISTRTVKALADVEAFALGNKQLKIIATQFKQLNSNQLQHTFQLHSPQWRTWAATYIQAAWRSYRRRKAGILLDEAQKDYSLQKPLAANKAGNGSSIGGKGKAAASITTIQKPKEPEFLDGRYLPGT